jgi:hypothetical protein
MINCSLILYVQPRGQKHGLRSSSNSPSLFFFFFLACAIYIYMLKGVCVVRWEGLHNFLSTDRTNLYCGDKRGTQGFTKSSKNLHMYWILGAGHFVSQTKPLLTLLIITLFSTEKDYTNSLFYRPYFTI